MVELSILSDSDVFFFYGKNDIQIENEHDLVSGLIQPKRSLYYFRSEGCGVAEKENLPNSLTLAVGMRYDITNWCGFRNTQVTDGENETPDRRIAVSQNTIDIQQNKGDMNIHVGYIPFENAEKLGKISIPLIKGF